jgi:hypothetical protein
MLGERLLVTREQCAIARFRLATPDLRVLALADVAQNAGELRRVIGIVGSERQAAEDGRWPWWSPRPGRLLRRLRRRGPLGLTRTAGACNGRPFRPYGDRWAPGRVLDDRGGPEFRTPGPVVLPFNSDGPNPGDGYLLIPPSFRFQELDHRRRGGRISPPHVPFSSPPRHVRCPTAGQSSPHRATPRCRAVQVPRQLVRLKRSPLRAAGRSVILQRSQRAGALHAVWVLHLESRE